MGLNVPKVQALSHDNTMRGAQLRSLGLCLALLLPVAAPAQGLTTEVRLALSEAQARPGQTVWAGVVMRLKSGWHNYWRNAGDSGAPTQIHWTLPPGVSAGAIQWPVPRKLIEEGLTTYIYDGEVVLLVPLTLATNLPAGPLELKARVDWLECEKECVMRNADVAANLLIGADSKPTADAALIQGWLQKVPRFDPAFPARATWERPAAGDARPVIIEWDQPGSPAVADFFPDPSDGFQVTNATERLPAGPGKVRLRTVVYKDEGNWPTELRGLIIDQATAASPVEAHAVHLRLAGLASPASAVSAGLVRQSLLLMLGFAFLGGLILNVMPCVLPVIALKILGFVSQSREAPRRVRTLGLIYGVGVLVSFLALAGVVIAVQHAGHAANWGMQFQNLKFLVLMTTLVTLVALNLFGVFEVHLGGRAMGAAGQLAAKEGAPGAFFNGVLATALATPCTAPFLAPALGFAFAQSAAVILVMFVAIGLGLASPYVVLSWHPAWLRFLPKPGLWMERFKQAMGFPMLATALWLFTLTTPYFGEGAPFWFGLYLVLVALAVWVYGAFVQRASRHRLIAGVIALAVAVFAVGFVLEHQLDWRAAGPNSRALAHARASGGIDWLPWSAAAVQQARAAGHPVLVDFTADWCLTCQVNRKTSIEVAPVRARLKALNAVAMVGDYTRPNDAITAELKKFGRAGVPLVLVYPADPKAEPIALPDGFLTPTVVLEALNKAAQSTPARGGPAAARASALRSTARLLRADRLGHHGPPARRERDASAGRPDLNRNRNLRLDGRRGARVVFRGSFMATDKKPLVAVIMGSQADWETMQHASVQLDALQVPHEVQVLSAHRAPDALFEYVASAADRGLEVIIAGAGGAAHLPGVAAAKTVLPVLGVPMESKALHGMDSLLAIVQMPGGVPVGTLAIGKAGAINAALLAVAILGNKHPQFRAAYQRFREDQTAQVLAHRVPR